MLPITGKKAKDASGNSMSWHEVRLEWLDFAKSENRCAQTGLHASACFEQYFSYINSA
jgi:hypothetical protein